MQDILVDLEELINAMTLLKYILKNQITIYKKKKD
jgi:hypothetical protein